MSPRPPFLSSGGWAARPTVYIPPAQNGPPEDGAMAPHTKTSTINSPVRPVLPGWPPPRSRSAGRPRHGPSRRSRWTAGTSSDPPGCTWRRQGPSWLHPVEVCPEPFLDRADQLRADLGLHRLPVPAGLASDRRDHLPELLQHFHLSHSFLLIDRGRGPRHRLWGCRDACLRPAGPPMARLLCTLQGRNVEGY